MGLNDSSLTAFDFFAGGGGASLGLHRAGINMLAALNHSPVAIATHEANFPGAKHLLCDIRVQKSWGLGQADIMWASPDCTHHSIAKGGQSRDAKERALAEELPRFAYNLNVNCIMVENVKEFLDWGPMTEKRDKDGHIVYEKKKKGRRRHKAEEPRQLVPVMVPIKARKKEYYNQWLSTMQALGFVNYEYGLLNAADFGVPQSRVRYFGIFTRKGIPIRWPEPTHSRHGGPGALAIFNRDGIRLSPAKSSGPNLPKWTAVRTVLDLDDKGRSIFTQWDQGPGRKPGDKPADKTLRRILAGLQKHVIGAGGTEFLDKRTSNPPSGKPGTGASTKHPAPTMATCYLPDLITPVRVLFDPYAWGGAMRSVERESPTIVASQEKAPLGMVTADFITKAFGGDPRYQSLSLDDTTGAITCADHHQVNTAFMAHSYSGRGQSSALCNPHPACLCNPHGNLVTPVFLAQYNGGSDNCRVLSLGGVSNTVPVENRFGLISLAFMAQSNGVSKNVSPAAKTWRLNTAGRTILATPNQSLIQVLVQSNGVRANDSAARLTMPLTGQAPVLNTNGGNLRLLSCLMSYFGTGGLHRLCKPCGALCTRDNYAMLGFMTGSGYGQPPYPFTRAASPILASRRHQYLLLAAPGSPVADMAGDSEAMRELKEVCRQHGIADIYMRMLKVSELKLIMGFPADYSLSGSATKQKEMLGNAVVPQVSEAIATAMTPSLLAARLRKLPKLRVDAINRYEQAQVFGKEVVTA